MKIVSTFVPDMNVAPSSNSATLTPTASEAITIIEADISHRVLNIHRLLDNISVLINQNYRELVPGPRVITNERQPQIPSLRTFAKAALTQPDFELWMTKTLLSDDYTKIDVYLGEHGFPAIGFLAFAGVYSDYKGNQDTFENLIALFAEVDIELKCLLNRFDHIEDRKLIQELIKNVQGIIAKENSILSNLCGFVDNQVLRILVKKHEILLQKKCFHLIKPTDLDSLVDFVEQIVPVYNDLISKRVRIRDSMHLKFGVFCLVMMGIAISTATTATTMGLLQQPANTSDTNAMLGYSFSIIGVIFSAVVFAVGVLGCCSFFYAVNNLIKYCMGSSSALRIDYEVNANEMSEFFSALQPIFSNINSINPTLWRNKLDRLDCTPEKLESIIKNTPTLPLTESEAERLSLILSALKVCRDIAISTYEDFKCIEESIPNLHQITDQKLLSKFAEQLKSCVGNIPGLFRLAEQYPAARSSDVVIDMESNTEGSGSDVSQDISPSSSKGDRDIELQVIGFRG